ncbi:MAG: DUF1700 domain-containing protein [Clostridia bacterium]|nr:DUF1700 domain-containing protein [Clostridia bacterium]
MNKEAFLSSLRHALADIPQEDLEKSVEFYSEMLDDRIEDGMTEEAAVSSVGDVSEIASQIRADLPLPTLMRMKMPRRQLRPWEIILLILGSPVWLPILASLFIILLSVYLVIWSLVLSLFAVAIYLICGFVCGIVLSALNYLHVDLLHAALLFGMSCILGGFSIILCMLSVRLIKGVCKLTKSCVLHLKCRLSRKEVKAQ